MANTPSLSGKRSLAHWSKLTLSRNLIHASDGFDSATKEIGLWFDEAELADYEPIAWVSRAFSGLRGRTNDSLGSWPTTKPFRESPSRLPKMHQIKYDHLSYTRLPTPCSSSAAFRLVLQAVPELAV